MRNSYQDGKWLFEEIGLTFHSGTVGNFTGWVDVEDGEIATIWLLTDEPDGGHGRVSIATGSYLHKHILPQIAAALPGMIEWQAGAKKNLTATSRAQTRALVTP
jgi:hypothetical protein